MSALIYQAMAAITKEIGPIAKRQPGRDSQIKYNFRSADDVYDRLNEMFAKHGVFVTTKVQKFEKYDTTSKAGGGIVHAIVHLSVTYATTDGSSVTSEGVGESKDSGDKAFAKAQTCAVKTAHLNTFCIPLNGIPESDGDDDEPQEQAPKATVGLQLAIDMAKRATDMTSLSKIKDGVTQRITEGKFTAEDGKAFDKAFYDRVKQLNPQPGV